MADLKQRVEKIDGARIVTLFALLAVPFLTTTCLATLDMRAAGKVVALALGLAAALLGLYLTAKLHFASKFAGTANSHWTSDRSCSRTKP